MAEEQKSPAPRALTELDGTLKRLRADEANEQRTNADRRDALQSGWKQIAPLLQEAVEHVNAVLGKHGYNGIEMAAPSFNAATGASYGAPGCIPGVNSADLLVVLSDDMVLYLNANCGGHWSEGYQVPVQGATVEAIAEALAEIAKELIAEEPG